MTKFITWFKKQNSYTKTLVIFKIILATVFLGILLWTLPTFIKAFKEYNAVLKIGGGGV